MVLLRVVPARVSWCDALVRRIKTQLVLQHHADGRSSCHSIKCCRHGTYSVASYSRLGRSGPIFRGSSAATAYARYQSGLSRHGNRLSSTDDIRCSSQMRNPSLPLACTAWVQVAYHLSVKMLQAAMGRAAP